VEVDGPGFTVRSGFALRGGAVVQETDDTVRW